MKAKIIFEDNSYLGDALQFETMLKANGYNAKLEVTKIGFVIAVSKNKKTKESE